MVFSHLWLMKGNANLLWGGLQVFAGTTEKK